MSPVNGSSMVFLMHLPQAAIGDMRINLGGGNGAVAEHFLDRSNIRAVSKERGSKTVPERVR